MESINVKDGVLREADLELVVDRLEKGDVVALPTDTSYGLCADASNEKAVKKVFAVKKRSFDKPLSIIISDFSMLSQIAEVDEKKTKIMQQHLPGPFTFIVDRKEDVLDIASAHGKTIGVRMPNHPLVKQIASRIDFPLTATSANLSGDEAFYSAQQIRKTFSSEDVQPDLIVNVGNIPTNPPSTIVDLACFLPKIMRQGKGIFKA